MLPHIPTLAVAHPPRLPCMALTAASDPPAFTCLVRTSSQRKRSLRLSLRSQCATRSSVHAALHSVRVVTPGLPARATALLTHRPSQGCACRHGDSAPHYIWWCARMSARHHHRRHLTGHISSSAHPHPQARLLLQARLQKVKRRHRATRPGQGGRPRHAHALPHQGQAPPLHGCR